MRQANKSFIQYILMIGLVFTINNILYSQTDDPGDFDVGACAYIQDFDGPLQPLYDSAPRYTLFNSESANGVWNSTNGVIFNGTGNFGDHSGEFWGSPAAFPIAVAPNRQYRFSFRLNGGLINQTVVDAYINGVKVGGPVMVLNSWTTFNFVWNSGAATTADLSLVNLNPNANGNDFRITEIELCALPDFGDAPNPYLTQLVANGPQHVIPGVSASSLFLGSGMTGELDAIISSGDASDDSLDDGVSSFPTQAVAGVSTVTGISTTNATGGNAMLCGWFDFNQDGSFDNDPNTSTTGDDPNVGSAVDSGERSCINIPDGTTSADLSWTIPIAELPNTGNFYFRFRLTTDASFFSAPSPIGAVSDGEVEDYLAVDVLPVELSYFGVEATNAGVLVKWTTESETENLGFTLDRRVEGTEEWNQIATYQTNDALLGQGSIPSATDYEYLDALVEASTTYEYRLADVDYKNTVTYHATRTVTVSSTPSAREVPDEFTVKEAYPNPFNPSTTIEYSLPVIASGAPQTGQAQQSQVQLQIYDITGKLITTLIDQVQPSGWHSVQWNGKDQVGANVPAGAYLVRVKAGTDVRHTKVMLLK